MTTERTITLPLSPANWARISVSLPLTPDEWERLRIILDTMKPALVQTPDGVEG